MKNKSEIDFNDEEKGLITDLIKKLIELTKLNQLIWIHSEHWNSFFCNFNGHMLRILYPEDTDDGASMFPSADCPKLMIDNVDGFLSVYPIKGIRNNPDDPNIVTLTNNNDYHFYELLGAIRNQFSEYSRQKKIRDEYWEVGNSQFKYLSDKKTFVESVKEIAS